MPPSSRALDTLADPDAAISFGLSIDAFEHRDAESWARACFEHIPQAAQWFLLVGWRFGLRLDLGPRPSPSHVLGWQIISSTPEVAVLEARGRLLIAHNVLEVQDGRIVLTTFVRYEHRAARPVWSVVAPVHGLIVRGLLRHAARE